MSKEEYYFSFETCFIKEIHNSEQDPRCSVAEVRVPASSSTRLHALESTSERYAVMKGVGIVTIEGEAQELRAGDVAIIPPGAAQKIENSGNEDLLFLAICTPRFEINNYIDLEQQP